MWVALSVINIKILYSKADVFKSIKKLYKYIQYMVIYMYN